MEAKSKSVVVMLTTVTQSGSVIFQPSLAPGGGEEREREMGPGLTNPARRSDGATTPRPNRWDQWEMLECDLWRSEHSQTRREIISVAD